MDFFGATYDSLYVNNNGNVTFDAPLSEYTPFDLLSTSTKIIAPFFADVDTSGSGSGLVQYGANTLAGRNVFGVNWINVGYYGSHTDKLNSFQLIIIDRSDIQAGACDIEFNYDQIQWETGDASDGVGGLGGDSARAGWSNGVDKSYEAPGSAVNGALLDGGPNSLVAGSLNSDTPGRCVFVVRNGEIASVDLMDLTLWVTSQAVRSCLRQSDLVLDGAHGRPLMRRTGDEDKNVFWIDGDWGHDEHDSHDGYLGVAEMGYGRNLGPVQLNAALGRAWNRQHLPIGGLFDHRGYYLLLEALAPAVKIRDSQLWVTVGGYYQIGHASIERGYIVNEGDPDFSEGEPDLTLWRIRARVDWDEAVKLGKVTFTPFAEVAYGKVHLASYDEVDGGFPAHFNTCSDTVTDARAGFDVAWAVAETVRILGRVEFTHRFEDEGPAVTGEVVTVDEFMYEGEDYDQNWWRGALGVEKRVGSSSITCMLNGTTDGEDPLYWVSVNWQHLY